MTSTWQVKTDDGTLTKFRASRMFAERTQLLTFYDSTEDNALPVFVVPFERLTFARHFVSEDPPQ